MSLQDSHQISNVKIMLVKGENGSSIESIEKTGTSGIVDTYTITLDNGEKYTFTVTNGTGSSAEEISYTNLSSGMSADDVQEAIDELGTYRTFNVATTDWIANTDPNTSTAYPYVATIATAIYNNNSHPIWEMTGVGTVPTLAEREEISKVAEAIFSTTGITLYAIGSVAEALVVEVKGL